MCETTANMEEIKRDYDRNGFVIIRGYLSAEELQELRDQTHRFFEENPLEGGLLGCVFEDRSRLGSEVRSKERQDGLK